MNIQNVLESPAIYTISVGSMYLGTMAFFTKVENYVSDDVKKQLGLWLKRENLEADNFKLARLISETLTRFFGDNHWSPNCFLRTAVVSLIVMSLVTLLGRSFNSSVAFMVRENLRVLGVGFIVFVLFADYISIGKTRFLLKKMETTLGVGRLLSFAFLDVVISLALVFAFLFIFQIALMLFVPRHDWLIVVDSMQASLQGLLLPFGSNHPDAWFGVFIYSTFLTSIWASLFALSVATIRFLSRADRFRSVVMKYLRVEQYPLTIIGFFLTTIFVLAYTVVALIGGA